MYKFITILLIQVLCGMEMDLFIPSFPELQQVFSLTPAMVQLTISLNFVSFCVCSLFAGFLGDRFNRRHVLLLGMLIFVLGSICCVFAPNFTCLLLGRFLQGIGISAPAILSFPVLLEAYDSDKQAGVMGVINGVKTLAMAIAPVIGSFVNLYFNWRANFSILLILGFICLIAACFTVPSKPGDKTLSFSIRSYAVLIKSKNYLSLVMGVSLPVGAYWMFMGMAPIFYMEGMKVSLKHFGYYQGSLSLAFALVCILSPMLFNKYKQKSLLLFGLTLCVLSVMLILGLLILDINQPLWITSVLILFSIGIVFPINILYPLSLDVVPDTKGRSAGLGQAFVLLLTAVLLELVSLCYQGKFMPMGIAMFILTSIATMLILQMIMSRKILA